MKSRWTENIEWKANTFKNLQTNKDILEKLFQKDHINIPTDIEPKLDLFDDSPPKEINIETMM